MNNVYVQLLISFIGSIPALFLALWVERQRMPKLKIIASEEANADSTYSQPSARAGERWKFFRVSVINEPFVFPFCWIPKQTAENCRAKIEISKIGSDKLSFTMDGRWASTPELPHISNDVILKLLKPDPVTISVGEYEYLDVITKYENDKEAYGWNNASYFNNWRTPSYKLERGQYLVKISISTQNGVTFSQKFSLQIADKIEDTYLK